MTSLFDQLPRQIARLEGKYGSDHSYVLELKAHLAAGPRPPSATQTYWVQAVPYIAPDPADAVRAWVNAQHAAEGTAEGGTK